VIIAGASVSGLSAAEKAASAGASVLILEDDLEVGNPCKCDGLVSVNAMQQMGVTLDSTLIQNEIKKARLHSPGDVIVELEASRQKVIVLDRRILDLQLARRAYQAGAQILLGQRVKSFANMNEGVSVHTSEGELQTEVAIDGSGPGSLIPDNKDLIMQAARYEVHGNWFDEHTVELYFDSDKFPGFFAWLIPIAADKAKVGAAGHGINAFRALDHFLEEWGAHYVVQKTAAPIVVDGPIASFTSGRVMKVGDAAAQSKPTTAGGIYTGGVAGAMAGTSAAEASLNHNVGALVEYEKLWRDRFEWEFSVMRRARGILAGLDNRMLDKLFKALKESRIPEILSEEGDFDLHAHSIMRLFRERSIYKVLGVLAASQITSLTSMILKKGR
jgi:geranylgeranyl reductase family protein